MVSVVLVFGSNCCIISSRSCLLCVYPVCLSCLRLLCVLIVCLIRAVLGFGWSWPLLRLCFVDQWVKFLKYSSDACDFVIGIQQSP